MNNIPKKRLNRVDLSLPILGFGCAALGNLYTTVSEEEAVKTLDTAYKVGIRYFDSAPLYGHGLAELRLGSGLRRFPDHDVVLSTKVGWRLCSAYSGETCGKSLPAFSRYNDYSYDGTMRSLEDSMQRLGTDQLDIVFIHDVDRRTQGDRYSKVFNEAMNGSYRALEKLRADGVIKAIGVGVNEWQPCQEFAQVGDFDCFLLAGRYTLLEQDALETFLPLCEQRNIGVVLGGVYNSGILASGARHGAMYDYEPAANFVLERVRAIEQVCIAHHVPLKAAALQFPLHHPAIISIIPGARTVAEVEDNFAMLRASIPIELWQDLRTKGFLREDAPVCGESVSRRGLEASGGGSVF